jgi:LPS sulfotransferase NodH
MLLAAGACTGGEEFFESVATLPGLLPGLGLASVEAAKADLPAYIERLKRAHATPGKRFCVKIQWYQLLEWQPHGLDLQRHFPGARYVVSTRTNLAAQVVSLVRALQTGGWTASNPTRDADPQYGFWKLMYEMSRLVQEEQSWAAYLRERGIEPYPLRYEDLDQDYREESLRLLAWLDVTIGPWRKRRLKPPIAKQRDRLNRDWEDRFYRDLTHWQAQWRQARPT